MSAVPFTLNHSFDCPCGKNHSFNTQVYNEDEAVRAFAALMPKGARVLYVGDSEKYRETLLKFYRLDSFNPVTGLLTCLNCDPVALNPQELILLLQTSALEDLKMIAGSGAGTEFAKYLAHKSGLKLVILGNGNLSEYSYAHGGDGFVSLVRSSCEGIILSERDINLPQGFAGVINTLLSLFDWEISALLYGGDGAEVCSFIVKEAKKTVISLLNTAKEYTKRSPELKKALVKAQLRLAMLSCYCDSGALFINGAYQAAAALNLLMLNEDRQSKSITENAFMFAPVVAKIYAAFFDRLNIFLPPPDNNLRLEKISEYLGVEQTKAQTLMADYFCREDLERADYRLALYKNELKQSIDKTCKILDEAYGLFLRLYADDGFSLKGYLDSLDISLCIGLAPDILQGNTLLSYMRHKGLLDKYIL